MKSTDLHLILRSRRKHFHSQNVYNMLRTATWCWCAKNVKCCDCFTARKPQTRTSSIVVTQTWWTFFYLWCFCITTSILSKGNIVKRDWCRTNTAYCQCTNTCRGGYREYLKKYSILSICQPIDLHTCKLVLCKLVH